MKGKFIRVLIALVLVLSLNLVTAVPAAATTLNVIPFTLGGDATAAWSDLDPKSGSYSVLLSDGGTAGSAGTVEFTVNIPLADITDLSFWFNHDTPDAAFDNFIPALSLHLDTNADGNQDAAVALNADTAGTPLFADGTWDQWTLAEWDNWHDSEGQWNMTLADAQTKFGGAMVLHVMVGEGGWGSGTWVESTAYVDDIAITTADGTTTYDLEGTAADYTTIQSAITAAGTGDTITVAAGTYIEDLVIPADKTGLELSGDMGATIKQVQLSSDFPNGLANIGILASGVKVHGFTIQGPEAGDGWAAGIVIGAHPSSEFGEADVQDIEIYDNVFEITAATSDPSVGIQTSHYLNIPLLDFHGLSIHDNTFTSYGEAVVYGYDGIYINPDKEGTGSISITDNEFSGSSLRAITIERSNVVVSGNVMVADDGWRMAGVLIRDYWGVTQDAVTVTNNSIEGFETGILIGQPAPPESAPPQILTNIVIEGNRILGNDTGVEVRCSADGVTLSGNAIVGNVDYGVSNTAESGEVDATNNWWGAASGPDHVSNPLITTGDSVSDDVDFLPWLDAAYPGGSQTGPVVNSITSAIYLTIQAAIDLADPGNTILVAAGVYEENLYIDKSLTVQSEDGAITDITEELEWSVVTELAGDVEIALGLDTDEETPLAETVVFDGFYIYGQEDPIYIEAVNNGSSLTISNNVLEGFDVGIDGYTVDNASSVTIEDNYILGDEEWLTSSEGIYFAAVEGGSDLTIRENLVLWSDYGIFIGSVVEESTVTIEDNIIAENYFGIEFNDVDESTITIAGNTIGANGVSGIYFSGGEDEDTVSDSTITIGGDTRAEGNLIIDNGYYQGAVGGIYVDSLVASSLEILNNDILDNSPDGVYIWFFDEDSTVDIHLNSIVDNDSYGVRNGADDYTIDATGNWWGDVAGPYDSEGPDPFNPYNGFTGGDWVYGVVDYIPWMIQNELAEGWNIWSAPIAADAASWAQMQAELAEDGMLAIYYYDSATQLWGTDSDDAGSLDAFYIKMPADGRIRYGISDEATFPGQKAMKVGWNFVGPAQLYDVNVHEALFSAFYATGVAEDLWGYTEVISPSLNGILWQYTRDTAPGFREFVPTRGYWVFMINDGGLNGSTSTPIVEIAEPQ